MAVMSLQLSSGEEKMMDFLAGYYELDYRSIFRRAIQDLYEDLVDRKAIEDYEEREHAGTVSFTSSDDVLKMLAGLQKA
jgi:predicted transcriptional regulator